MRHTHSPPDSFTGFTGHRGQQPFSAVQIQPPEGSISSLSDRRWPELAFGDEMETVVETVSKSQVCCRLATGVL